MKVEQVEKEESGRGATELSADDRRDVAAHGLDVGEVLRQLGLLRSPPAPIRLLRPCTPGDGVEILGPAQVGDCLEAHRRAAEAGRLRCFVPASGAASRMFKSLQAVRDASGEVRRSELERHAASGDRDAASVLELLAGLPRLALREEIERALVARGLELEAARRDESLGPLLGVLLDADGLDLANRAKGLLPFHRYPGGVRTAFEEHLVDAASYARGPEGETHLHFTVSDAHRSAFAALLEDRRRAYEDRFGVRLEVGFSTQSPATDTVALDESGRPFRDGDGKLLFRPGGHGALLANLGDLARAGADLVFVKNIDNVVPDHLKPPVVHWKKVLAGRLALLAEEVHATLRRLQEAGPAERAAAAEAARTLLADRLRIPLPPGLRGASGDEQASWLQARLDRPIRVCGVVRCEGDPGGAPFWVVDEEAGASAQIVETAQVDARDPSQLAIHRSASHFNPVDLVCSLRDHRGQPHALARHVDPNAVFIAEKSSGGRALRALEHPGLWNGAMAYWLTLFVEVPAATFHPVKTINDLIADDHQPPAGAAAG